MEMTNKLFSERKGKMTSEIRVNKHAARLHVTRNAYDWNTIEITPELAEQMITVLTSYVEEAKDEIEMG